jgi:hypothetical protein
MEVVMEGEKVLGAIPVQWKKGFLNLQPWTIVVTSARLIFARFTQDMQRNVARDQAQQAGGNWLKQMAAAATSGFTYHQRYFQMDPEVILQEWQENWWVDARGVSRAVLTQGRWTHSNNVRTQNDHELVIVTTQGKFAYSINPTLAAGEQANLLSQVLGGALTFR